MGTRLVNPVFAEKGILKYCKALLYQILMPCLTLTLDFMECDVP